jgi:hypothetical protein
MKIFEWENSQTLRCKFCQCPVYVPSKIWGKPHAPAVWLESMEHNHIDGPKFSTPAEARADRKWKIALHYAQRDETARAMRLKLATA